MTTINEIRRERGQSELGPKIEQEKMPSPQLYHEFEKPNLEAMIQLTAALNEGVQITLRKENDYFHCSFSDGRHGVGPFYLSTAVKNAADCIPEK